MTILDLPPRAVPGVEVGEGWIRGKVVLRSTTIRLAEIRRVVRWADERGGDSLIVEAGSLRGVAVPVPRLREDPELRTAMARLVRAAAAQGAAVPAAVLDALTD